MDQNNLPKTVAQEATQIATTQGGKKAGHFLETIADEKGDTFLMEQVFPNLSIDVVAKTVREFDSTIPSIIAVLMDPEKVAEMVKVEPTYWDLNDESNFDAQQNVISILVQFTDEQPHHKKLELIEAIASSEFGLQYMSVGFIGIDFQKFNENYTFDFENYENYGTDVYMLSFIRCYLPKIYNQILDYLNSYDFSKLVDSVKTQADEQKIGALNVDEMFSPATKT